MSYNEIFLSKINRQVQGQLSKLELRICKLACFFFNLTLINRQVQNPLSKQKRIELGRLRIFIITACCLRVNLAVLCFKSSWNVECITLSD